MILRFTCSDAYLGALTRRLCTSAEISFYFRSLFQKEGNTSGNNNFLKPNLNCNLSSWVSGCEPGWSCSIGEDKKLKLQAYTEIPERNLNCRPCCEGFFCPRGLTCMMRKCPSLVLWILWPALYFYIWHFWIWLWDWFLDYVTFLLAIIYSCSCPFQQTHLDMYMKHTLFLNHPPSPAVIHVIFSSSVRVINLQTVTI